LSFKSLFLVNVLTSTVDQSHHLLVKFSCKNACENHDAVSARSAVCFLHPMLQSGAGPEGGDWGDRPPLKTYESNFFSPIFCTIRKTPFAI